MAKLELTPQGHKHSVTVGRSYSDDKKTKPLFISVQEHAEGAFKEVTIYLSIPQMRDLADWIKDETYKLENELIQEKQKKEKEKAKKKSKKKRGKK